MGGVGSGRRWRFDAKDTVDDARSIDVRRWQRDRLLNPGQSFGWNWSRHGETVASIRVRVEEDCLLLSYRYRRNGNDWQEVEQPVPLDVTPCNYGGGRYWFRCPTDGCGRRVAILYGAGRYFACRHCYQLVYPCQRETAIDRAARRADKVRDRLGWEPGILNGPGWRKPKGMHQRTFDRLRAQEASFTGQALQGMSQKLGIDWDD